MAARLVDLALSHYSDAVSYKWAVAGEKHTNWDFLQAWKDGKPRSQARQNQSGYARVNPNFIGATCDLIKSAYIGDDPEVTMAPQEPGDEALAEQLNALHRSDWQAGSAQDELDLIVDDGIGIGTGVWKRYYDNVLCRLVRRRMDSRHFFVHPKADTHLLSTDEVFTVALVPLEKVWRLYGPGAFKTGNVTPELMRLAYESDYVFRLGETLPGLALPNPPGTLSAVPYGIGIEKSDVALKASAAVAQFWCRDVGLIDWCLDSDTLAKIKYEWSQPSGVITIVGTKVVSVEENPWARDLAKSKKRGGAIHETGTFPFSRFSSRYRSGNWWGKGEVEDLIDPQRAINVISSRITEHVQKTVRPPWIYDRDKGSSFPSRMVWDGDKVYGVKGGSDALKPVFPAEIAPYVFRFLDTLKSWEIFISGANEASFGMRQPGVPSGVGIRQLQSTFYARNAPRRHALERMIAHDAYSWIEMAFATYDQERVERLLGPGRAAGWDKYRAEALGRFDVQINISGASIMDPTSQLQMTTELAKLQAFDLADANGNPLGLNQVNRNLKILKKVRRFLDVEGDIRDLEKRKRGLIEDEIDQRMGRVPAAERQSNMTAPMPQELPVEVA